MARRRSSHQVTKKFADCDECFHNYGGSACCDCDEGSELEPSDVVTRNTRIDPSNWGPTLVQLFKELKAAGFHVEGNVGFDEDTTCCVGFGLRAPDGLPPVFRVKIEGAGRHVVGSCPDDPEERPDLNEAIRELEHVYKITGRGSSSIRQAIRFLRRYKKERGA
jgi:hypothetical protein